MPYRPTNPETDTSWTDPCFAASPRRCPPYCSRYSRAAAPTPNSPGTARSPGRSTGRPPPGPRRSPPLGGAAGTTLTFTQLGSGAYTAANDRGNPFTLTTLNFASAGGGITVSNLAGNALEFVGAAGINQNGLGNAVFSAASTLTAPTTTVGGTATGGLAISGVLSGAGGVTINRPQSSLNTGLTDLTGVNTFAGGVTLQAGNLRVGNAAALGTGTLTVNGGTLGASVAVTLANAIALNADLVYSGFSGLTLTGAIGETGSRGLTVSAPTSATLTLQGANTYTGATAVLVNPFASSNAPAIGGLTLSGANGSSALSSGFTVNGGGTLTLTNSVAGANNNNRIGDGAPVTLSGATFAISGANGGATLENIGTLSGGGAVAVTIDAGTTGNTGTTLQADALTRLNRGHFIFRGNSAAFGGPLAANVANLLFDTAPTLVGGGGAGTTTISIIPYALGGTTTGSVGTELVTYGPNGVRPLLMANNEYAATIASGSTTADNVRLATAQAVVAPTQVNALVIATATPFTGSTSTLTVNAGTVLVSTAATIPTAMTLAFGGSEGSLFTNSVLTADGILTGTNGLTKSGGSNLVLTNAANSVTGTLTLNQGAVAFTDPAVVGSFTDVRVSGRSSTATPGFNFTPATGAATLSQPIAVTDGFLSLVTGGGTLTVAGAVSGPGGVLVNLGNVELTNTANSYTGQTRVFNGNLLVSSDAVLGNGGGVDLGASTTTGLRLMGDWTTSRRISFSFSSQVDTNGFNWTVNSPVTGVAGTINKVGAGVWTLAAGGSLGQSLTTTTTGTTTTLNVNAGELRVTNPTGSATGTATVAVANTATVSGTGSIAGATTVATTAFVRPGTGGGTLGTLGFGGTLAINGTFAVDAAGVSADRVNVAGALTLGSASVLDLTAGTYDPSTAYTLLSFASLTGTFSATPGVPISHTLVYNTTSLVLTPVPEPGLMLVAAAAALGALGARRRLARGLRTVVAA